MATSELSILLQLKDQATKDLKSFQKVIEDNKKAINDMAKYSAIAGGAIVGAFGLAAKAAEDERVNIARLNVMLKNVGTSYDQVSDSLERNIDATMRKTGISDTEQRDILGRLVLVTNDYNKALSLLPLTLDLAAAGEMDAATAATYLGKAYTDLENGAESVTVRLGQASMQFKSLAEIQERVGGTAEAMASPLTILKETLGELAETVGAQVLPELTNMVNNMIPIIDKTMAWIKVNPELVKAIGTVGIALIAFAAATKSTIIALSIIAALQGPRGWISLGVAVAAAGGAYFGLDAILGKATASAAELNTTTVESTDVFVKQEGAASVAGKTMYRVAGETEKLKLETKDLVTFVDSLGNSYLTTAKAADEYATSMINYRKELAEYQNSLLKNYQRNEYDWMNAQNQAAASAAASRAAAVGGSVNDALAAYMATISNEETTAADRAAALANYQSSVDALGASKGLPGYQSGGIVPGPTGKPVPIIAHGGERYLGTSGGKGGGDVYLTVNAGYVDNPQKFASIVREELFKVMRYSRTSGIA